MGRKREEVEAESAMMIITPDVLRSMKKDELKAECKIRNLNVSGNKIDLIERLEASFQEDTPQKQQQSKSTSQTMNGSKLRTRTASESARLELRQDRASLVLWKRPFRTLDYGLRELFISCAEFVRKLLGHKKILFGLIVTLTSAVVAYQTEGSHQRAVQEWEKYLLWCLWWVGLGVLSSVGLGTGLHTFLLYLGPHIASVTMAAYECGNVDFPSPPYPDEIICAEDEDGGSTAAAITLWAIMSKVRVEAFCWGAGTALGELPPYFVARAHRLSGHDPDDDDEDEFEELQEKAKHPEQLNVFDRAKLGIEKLVERVGFFGILACASIPNPLFDLAGITCGHFLVPFWTFFGATLIGKAVVKMHLQKLFVILAFNETLIQSAVSYVAVVPWLEGPFKDFLAKQKEKLHRSKDASSAAHSAAQQPNILSWIFEKFVLLMIAYFAVSIVNSLAQSYHKRINKHAPVKKTFKKTDDIKED